MSKSQFLGRVSLCALAASAVLVVQPGRADAQTVSASQLQAELNNLQAQVNAIKAQQRALNSQAAQQAAVAQQQQAVTMQQVNFMQQEKALTAKMNKSTWYMSGDELVPAFKTYDGLSSFYIGGEIQLDAGIGSVPEVRDASGKFVAGLSHGGFSGGGEFRRIELAIGGIWKTHYVWKLQFDLSKTSSPLGSILDVYLGYTGKFGPVTSTVLVGHQHMAYDNQISNGATPFMETALGESIFQPPREFGIGGITYNKMFNAWYTFGISGTPKFTTQLPYAGNSQDTASTVLTFTPINSPGHLLSIRGSFAYNHYNSVSDNGTVTANEAAFSGTELNVYGNSFINTGSLAIQTGISESPRIDFEWGRFNTAGYAYFGQSYSNNYIVAIHKKLQPSFSAWGVEAQYFLTDDHQPYSTSNGYYIGIKPTHPVTEGGIGAFSVAARFDEANLNDAKDGVHGGNESNLTLGLNWIPTEALRFDLNYVKVFPIEGSYTGPNVNNNGKSASIVAVRMQLEY